MTMKIVILAAKPAFSNSSTIPIPLLPVGLPERPLLHRVVHLCSEAVGKEKVLVITTPELYEHARNSSWYEPSTDERSPTLFGVKAELTTEPQVHGSANSALRAIGFVSLNDFVALVDCDFLFRDSAVFFRTLKRLEATAAATGAAGAVLPSGVPVGMYAFYWPKFLRRVTSLTTPVLRVQDLVDLSTNSVEPASRIAVDEDWLSFRTMKDYERLKILT